jgi:hypothetical protein
MRAALQTRYGLDDEQFKGRAELSWTGARGIGLRVFGERDYRDAGDIVERSGLVNSIAAQEFGSDATEPFDVRGVGLGINLARDAGTSWQLDAAYERQEPVRVVAAPSRGRYEPVIEAEAGYALRAALGFDRPTSLFLGGTELQVKGEARATRFRSLGATRYVLRAFVDASVERPMGASRLVSRTTFAAVHASSDTVPPQELVYLGGPVSGAGYRFHELVGEIGGSQRLEWRRSAPFFAVPLGRFGNAPPRMTVAPFAQTVFTARTGSTSRPEGTRAAGWYPTLGVGALLFFDAMRVDVARGLRDGRWMFSIDVTPDLWRVL